MKPCFAADKKYEKKIRVKISNNIQTKPPMTT